ncbi:hypothetical protein [Nocardioides sp. zg-1228]|uniref:hypothetical protein n=1 Tax=Nocardioides sp. zg-1228 TaxID=2763008 RepID=UPI0016429B6C|nr:hypothetical protein [Nocardioides sp. zg-1228]MBC2933045.1 hypothetical protein [Nocardioides sp. zg-1228]QSF56761.1 hypothetical protein JX575_14290 [Nocardioides sp. zg-1228]
MRYTVLGSALAVLLAPLAAATPAHAANEVTLTMAGGVLYDSCATHDFTYSAALPAGYGPYWNMDVELVGPDGNVTSSAYIYGESRTGVGSILLCDSPNLPGTYTLRGSGEMRGPDYTYVPISAMQSTVTFRLPQTRTRLKAKPRRPAKGQVVRFVITSQDERPAGYFGTTYADVKLQAKRNGSWRTLDSTMTNDSGKVVVKARYSGRRTAVRAVTTGNSDRTGSTSRVIRFR